MYSRTLYTTEFQWTLDATHLGTSVYLNPGDPAPEPTTVFSRGLISLGDVDGDGRTDYALSAMLADPNGRKGAGEVYVLYGRGD